MTNSHEWKEISTSTFYTTEGKVPPGTPRDLKVLTVFQIIANWGLKTETTKGPPRYTSRQLNEE